MKRSPYVAALLSGALAFQLLLAGGGVTCDGAPHTSAAGMDVAMPGMPMSTAAGATISASGESPAEEHVPCDQPPSSPRSCLTMAPCAAAFVFVPLALVDSPWQDPSHVASATTPMPSSRTIPPEPPPPRA